MTYRRGGIRPPKPEDEPLLLALAPSYRGAGELALDVPGGETVFVAEGEGAAAG